ncbi:MAG: ABC transporter substrate-binding protein [Oscillospiraceae bacterium]|nr:ABC transporter substrate-binding protein [Oscillospiraceae bacterium]
MKRIVMLLLVLAICISMVTGCANAGSQQVTTANTTQAGEADAPTTGGVNTDQTAGVIKIGAPANMTGNSSGAADHAINGVRMAVEDLNAKGGVLGKQLEMVTADLKNYATEDVVAAAEYLQRQDVVANFVGGLVGTTAVHAFGKYPWIFMHGSADSASVLAYQENRDTYTGIFQMCDDEGGYAPFVYDAIMNKLPIELPNKKAALLGGDINYDMKIQEGFANLLEAAGWEIVLNDTYAYYNTEFSAQLATIRQEKPALILAQTTSNDSATAFMNQFWERPTDSIIYVQWAPSSPEFIDLLEDRANGIIWTTLSSMLPSDESTDFTTRYKAKYNMEPGNFANSCYDYVNVWATAVEAVGSETDYAAITEYIENLSDHPYFGLNGKYGMDKDRHSGIAADDYLPVLLYQIQDEKDVLLYIGAQKQEGVEYIKPSWIQ